MSFGLDWVLLLGYQIRISRHLRLFPTHSLTLLEFFTSFLFLSLSVLSTDVYLYSHLH